MRSWGWLGVVVGFAVAACATPETEMVPVDPVAYAQGKVEPLPQRHTAAERDAVLRQAHEERTRGWVAVGVGGAAVVTGAVVGFLALEEFETEVLCGVDTAVTLGGRCMPVDFGVPIDAGLATMAIGMLGGGLVAALGGVAVHDANVTRREVRSWTVLPTASAHGGGLTFGGRF